MLFEIFVAYFSRSTIVDSQRNIKKSTQFSSCHYESDDLLNCV